jgi:hypothetical protein
MEQTVFVVGAGASLEFDRVNKMPIGSKLAEQIESLLDAELRPTSNERPISSAIMRRGGMQDSHRAAMSRILHGIQSRDSIDQFIEDCKDVPELARIAKLCIAHLINEAERTTVLGVLQDQSDASSFRNLRDSWLGQICRRANPHINRQNFKDSLAGISFVTFNYDRCIEQFLYQWASSTLLAGEKRARSMASEIPVHHVYGTLGILPGFSPEAERAAVRFGEEDDRLLPRMAESIRTFTEQADSQTVESLRFALFNAQKVVFLGTGYHPQNLALLFPSGVPEGIKVFGTTFGMRAAELQRAEAFFARSGIKPVFHQHLCGQFITEVQDELFN